MISKILPYLDKFLPVGLAVKGLTATPQIASFIGSATAAGYGVDAVLDQLRDIYEPPIREEERKRISRKESHGVLRPDEIPRKNPKLLSKAAALGGAALSSRLLNKSDSIIPEVLPAEKMDKSIKSYSKLEEEKIRLPYERKEIGTSPKQKQIGFSPRTKVPEHKFPEPKVPPSSPVPPDIEEQVKFHMDKSGLSIEDAVDVTEALNPGKKKIIKDLKKKGAFESLRGATNTVAPSYPQLQESPATGEDEILRLIDELSRKLNG